MADALSQMYLMTDLLMPGNTSGSANYIINGNNASYFDSGVTVSGSNQQSMDHVNISAASSASMTWPPAPDTQQPPNMMMMQQHHQHQQHQWGPTSATNAVGLQQQQQAPLNGPREGAVTGTAGVLPYNSQHMQQNSVHNLNFPPQYQQQQPQPPPQMMANGSAPYHIAHRHPQQMYPGDSRSFNDVQIMEKGPIAAAAATANSSYPSIPLHNTRIPTNTSNATDYAAVMNNGMNHSNGVGNSSRLLSSLNISANSHQSHQQDNIGGYGLQPQIQTQQYYPNNDLPHAGYPTDSRSRMGPQIMGTAPPNSQRMRPYVLPPTQTQRRQMMMTSGGAAQPQMMYTEAAPEPVRYRGGHQQVPAVKTSSSAASAAVRGGNKATQQQQMMMFAEANAPQQQQQQLQTSSYPNSMTTGQQGAMYPAMQTAPAPMQYSASPQPQQPTVGGYGGGGGGMTGGGGQPLQIRQIPNPNCSIQPFVQAPDDEPRMTLPTQEEPLLHPFKLEHNLVGQPSHHIFILSPALYESLRANNDLQLELKCYQHNDHIAKKANWPEAINITINGTPVAIQRGAPGGGRIRGQSHRPLYIKTLCVPPPRKNQIVITASACCCSHLFVLQVVLRPTIRQFLHNLLQTRVLVDEQSVQKIKQLLHGPNRMTLSPAVLTAADELILSLKCPLTNQRMSIPARSVKCRHLSCWDLYTYLEVNSECNYFACPICKESAYSDEIEVDHYFWTILKQVPPVQPGTVEVDEVLIDGQAKWRASHSALRLSEPLPVPKYLPVSPAQQPHWESSPSHHFVQELPRSMSTGRNTPRGGPSSVGHPLSMCSSITSDYGSPASLSAIVPVSPSAKSFPGSVSSCPQESPAASSTFSHGGRTPVPQSMQYSGVGSFPSTPKTPAHSSGASLDFFDIFDGDGDTDADALQLLSEMDPSDIFSLLEGPPTGNSTSSSSSSSFPHSTGNASDSGISNVSSSTPAHSPEDGEQQRQQQQPVSSGGAIKAEETQPSTDSPLRQSNVT
ncbi:Zinc finger MIZ domain-containing protein 1 [Hypsibius exemplaris]|uniref:Zinc finger MIZ domain-containing protein 1 n=1 Tax=Hypsibius exemplaris TaxID=2072580 RepID=A0A1W0WTF3_HYPEX|nr:Zinc finger MIZ domain-containing protein 1 [Hypsibius exemplaris]